MTDGLYHHHHTHTLLASLTINDHQFTTHPCPCPCGSRLYPTCLLQWIWTWMFPWPQSPSLPLFRCQVRGVGGDHCLQGIGGTRAVRRCML